MPMWMCDFDACARPAVRTQGECTLCNRHICSEHLRNSLHDCPKWEDEVRYDPAAHAAEAREMEQLIAKINTTNLAAVASSLRNGIKCDAPQLAYNRATRSSVMGGMNYHINLQFEDGVSWIARIRRFNATSPPADVRDHIVRSEYATLKFLESVPIPTPRVYGFALENEPANNVGAGYILMERMPGKSYRDSAEADRHMEKTIGQLADIYLELSKHPFDLMGSLDEPSSIHVGGFARESLTDFNDGVMSAIGPCSSVEEYHTKSIQLILSLILRGEMYAEQPIDAYLIHRFLLDIIPAVLPASAPGEVFYLKHADEKGDQILVDDEYNITAIIDWEWAYTTSQELAFNSPITLLDVGQFYDGKLELSDKERYFASYLESRGAKALASAVRAGRKQHFFAFCTGYDLSDWSGFLGLFRGLRAAVDMDQSMDWDQWKATAMQRYARDSGLQILLQKE